jgi:hypothetical protein
MDHLEEDETHNLQRQCLQEKTVDIRRLKTFVSEKLPEGHLLRELVGAEGDLLKADEFLRKLRIWQRLLRKSRYENGSAYLFGRER